MSQTYVAIAAVETGPRSTLDLKRLEARRRTIIEQRRGL